MPGGVEMTVKDALTMSLQATKKTQTECAELMKWTVSKMNRKLNGGKFWADEFLKLMDVLGLDVQLVDRETGKIIKPMHQGAGPRVRQMVNGITYDTYQADALSNSFYADGVNKYTDDQAKELYMDREGRYFFAEYATYQERGRITPIDPETAARFIKKYGTEIYKVPGMGPDDDFEEDPTNGTAADLEPVEFEAS